MGSLREQQGRVSEAIRHYLAAIQGDATDIVSKNNVAWILATNRNENLRDGPQAVRLAREMRAQTGDERPELHDTLAAAYAEATFASRAWVPASTCVLRAAHTVG
jgi:hypothetical protein